MYGAIGVWFIGAISSVKFISMIGGTMKWDVSGVGTIGEVDGRVRLPRRKWRIVVMFGAEGRRTSESIIRKR